MSKPPSEMNGSPVSEIPEQAAAQQDPAALAGPAPRKQSSKWSLRSAVSRLRDTKNSTPKVLTSKSLTALDAGVPERRQYKPRHADRDAMFCVPRQAGDKDRARNGSTPGSSAQSPKGTTDPCAGPSTARGDGSAMDRQLPSPAVKSKIPRPEELGVSYEEWKQRYPYTYIASTDEETNQPFRRPAAVAVARPRPAVTVHLPEQGLKEQVHISLSQTDLAQLLRDNPNVDWGGNRMREHLHDGDAKVASTMASAGARTLSAKALGKRPVFETASSQSQAPPALQAPGPQPLPEDLRQAIVRGPKGQTAEQLGSVRAQQHIERAPSSAAGESSNSSDRHTDTRTASPAQLQIGYETPASSVPSSVSEQPVPAVLRFRKDVAPSGGTGKVFELDDSEAEMDEEMRAWAESQMAWLSLDET